MTIGVVDLSALPGNDRHAGKPIWLRLLAAMAAFTLLQILFWGMVTIAERQSRPEQMEQQPYVGFQMLDKEGEPLDQGQLLQAEYLGTSGYRADMPDKGELIRFTVLFNAHKDEQLALFLAIRENLKGVTVNGITVQPDVPLQQLQGAVMSEPAYYLLPRDVIQNGRNVIHITKVRDGMVAALPDFSIGPAEALASAYRWKNRYSVDIPLAGVAILAFALALCFAVNWPDRDVQRMRWLMLLLGSSAAFTLLLSFMAGFLPSLTFVVGLTAVFQLLIGLSAARYVAYEVHAAPIWHRLTNGVTVLGGGLLLCAFLWSLTAEERYEEWLPFVAWRSLTVAVILMAPGILALCWVLPTRWRRGGLELFVMALCLQTWVVDRLSSSVDIYSPFDQQLPISLYWSPIVGPLLGLAIIFFLARQAGEARDTVVRANLILADRLAVQDAELATSYDQQKAMLARQAMLEERQRIVRDMHDGIGGQLLGLMMRVRSGGLAGREVEDGLQASIADLRLIVDSMDTAEEGLAQALQSFEHRVRSQVEAAGFAFSFANSIGADVKLTGPRQTLQLLRILQEAVTNAMRHCNGTAIAVDASLAATRMRISVSDDGRGMDSDARPGRGLANMRSRAQHLGATFDIQSGQGGTRLILELPVPTAGVD